MNEIKDRYARAEAVYRTQLSRRRGQNEGRISTASKERSVLKDANRSAHDQLSHELKEREKQMLGEAEVKKKELAARHAKQIADLLEAQEAVKKALAKDQETQLAVARREGRGQLIELGQSNKGKKEALEERLVEQKQELEMAWGKEDRLFNDVRREAMGKEPMGEKPMGNTAHRIKASRPLSPARDDSPSKRVKTSPAGSHRGAQSPEMASPVGRWNGSNDRSPGWALPSRPQSERRNNSNGRSRVGQLPQSPISERERIYGRGVASSPAKLELE